MCTCILTVWYQQRTFPDVLPLTRKYHRDVYFPSPLLMLCQDTLCRCARHFELSQHARDRLAEKGVPFPTHIPVSRCTVIEATMEGRSLVKLLARFPQAGGPDIVFGLTVEGIVTTVYPNDHDDHHHTLRRNEYVRAA